MIHPYPSSLVCRAAGSVLRCREQSRRLVGPFSPRKCKLEKSLSRPENRNRHLHWGELADSRSALANHTNTPFDLLYKFVSCFDYSPRLLHSSRDVLNPGIRLCPHQDNGPWRPCLPENCGQPLKRIDLENFQAESSFKLSEPFAHLMPLLKLIETVEKRNDALERFVLGAKLDNARDIIASIRRCREMTSNR